MTQRRLFGPCGGAARRHVMAVGAADDTLGSNKDQEARAARRKAQK